MIEFKPKETDLVLDKRPRYPDLHKHLSEVRSIVFKDDADNIHDFLEFDSLYHFIDTMEEHYRDHSLRSILNDTHSGDNGDFNYSGNSKWTYGSTFKNRVATKEALLTSDVPDTMWKIIDKLRDSLLALEEVQRLIDMAPSIKKQRKFGLSGDELDIDRILAGDPHHWQYTTKGRKTNVVRIGLNIAMSCSNSADKFLKIVALASVAADLVIKAGCSLEFILCGLSTHVGTEHSNPYVDPDGSTIGNLSNGFSGPIMAIKKAEEPFDISRIACLGLPGLFRHYMFVSRTAYFSSQVDSGMGQSHPLSKELYERIGLKHVIGFKLVTGDDEQYDQKVFLRGIFDEIAGIKVPQENI